MMTVKLSGLMDVYFNLRSQYPWCWCVAPASRDRELIYKSVVLDGVVATTLTESPHETMSSENRSLDKPFGWIRVRGTLLADEHGNAVIRPLGAI